MRWSLPTVMLVCSACVLPPAPTGGACDSALGHLCPRGTCIDGRCVETVDGGDAGDGGTNDGGTDAGADCAAELCHVSAFRFGAVMTNVLAVGGDEAWFVGDDVVHVQNQTVEPVRPRLAQTTLMEVAGSRSQLFAAGPSSEPEFLFFRFDGSTWQRRPFTSPTGVQAMTAKDGVAYVGSGSAVMRYSDADGWRRFGSTPTGASIQNVALLPGGQVVAASGSTAWLLAPDAGPAELIPGGGDEIETTGVLPDGTVWAFFQNGVVARRAPRGTWAVVPVTNGVGLRAGGLWAAPSGDVFICGNRGAFVRFRPDGGETHYEVDTGALDEPRARLYWVAISGSAQDLWLSGRLTDSTGLRLLTDAGIGVHLRFK